MNRNYDVTTFISNTFILRKSKVANLADIIKIGTTFIKQPLKIQAKLKELEVIY